MTVKPEVLAEIKRRFFVDRWKRGTIARELCVHHDVVTRALGPNAPELRNTSEGLIEAYASFIDETLAQYPKLRATRLFDMAQQRGYAGSIRTLRRYVHHARPAPKVAAFLRIESFPGEQAQVDWGHVGKLPVLGGERPLWVFVMVLAHSRAMWAELVFDLTAASLRRSLLRASMFFGGVPRQWLFDNPKTIVVERSGEHVRFHSTLLEISSQLNVQPRVCGVRKPQEKGKVERSIRYLKERFFAARTFHSIEHGNAQLLEFFRTISNQRKHQVQRERTIDEVFELEQPRLLALPQTLPELETITPVSVDKTASVRVDTNNYSVPSKYAGRMLSLAYDDKLLRFIDGTQEVAQHPRCWGKHQRIEQPQHRADLLREKQSAMPAKGGDRLRNQVPGMDAILARWADDGRNMGTLVSATCKLLDMYGETVMQLAVAEMAVRGIFDKGAMAMLCEQFHRPRASETNLPIVFHNRVVDRDVPQLDLGGYDDQR
jgi:transposase